MKEHLCDCLDEYHKKIEKLKKELEYNSQNAELLRKQSRKYKHKHITINPSQMCDICFKPIFDREFYLYPCLHAYHRVCVQQKLEKYFTKDIEVKVVVDKLKSCFDQIKAKRDQALQLAQQHSGSFSDGAGASYMNDIEKLASGISGLVQKGANFIKDSNTATGRIGSALGLGASQEAINAIQEKDKQMIEQKLQEIDSILTSECYFCGSLLIDQVDNDIELREPIEGDEFDGDYEPEPTTGQGDWKRTMDVPGSDDWAIE